MGRGTHAPTGLPGVLCLKRGRRTLEGAAAAATPRGRQPGGEGGINYGVKCTLLSSHSRPPRPPHAKHKGGERRGDKPPGLEFDITW
ncbi:hypothetical protein Pcinc_015623 [Petrolisthes cinctipes]|uniref:Uncharacterized protein n=1 Tax=Petrolisthes cinctipes TaxID=88211 RepID=A0AAE1KMY0_PETCI|nr:hypothetical protein Pcinc_015623 [Petrolisthes cinctipes]